MLMGRFLSRKCHLYKVECSAIGLSQNISNGNMATLLMATLLMATLLMATLLMANTAHQTYPTAKYMAQICPKCRKESLTEITFLSNSSHSRRYSANRTTNYTFYVCTPIVSFSMRRIARHAEAVRKMVLYVDRIM